MLRSWASSQRPKPSAWPRPARRLRLGRLRGLCGGGCGSRRLGRFWGFGWFGRLGGRGRCGCRRLRRRRRSGRRLRACAEQQADQDDQADGDESGSVSRRTHLRFLLWLMCGVQRRCFNHLPSAIFFRSSPFVPLGQPKPSWQSPMPRAAQLRVEMHRKPPAGSWRRKRQSSGLRYRVILMAIASATRAASICGRPLLFGNRR